jgi:hypothetical protein
MVRLSITCDVFQNLSFFSLPDLDLDSPHLDQRNDHLNKTIAIVPNEVVPREIDVGNEPQGQNLSDRIPISSSLLPLSETDGVTSTEVRQCQFSVDGQY